MTMPVQTFRDLMDRTMINYEFIRKHAGDCGLFEVSQLMSSFIMVAGLPREHDLYKRLEGVSIDEARTRFGLPDFPVVAETANYGIRHMADLAGMFRNAVAHGNLTFYAEQHGDRIGAIRFSDERTRDKIKQKRNTNELTIEQIEQTLYAFQKIAHFLYDQEMAQFA